MAGQESSRASTVLIDEYFGAGDDRFLAELLPCRAPAKLKALAERWSSDSRAWARQTLLAYVDDGCDRPMHRALVKALYKRAEAAGDDELLGHFLVAFDRLNRRRLTEVRRYDWSTRSTRTSFVLKNDPSVVSRIPKEPARSRSIERFSRRTRRYLCRRVLRHFRRIGRRDPERYGRAVRAILGLYRDEQLQKPEQLLEAWGLVHLLYWGSPLLVRSPHGVRLAEGASLADLKPAPLYPAVWAQAFDEALDLAERAPSRTVRVFALALMTRDHAERLRTLSVTVLRRLLRCPHEEVQAFAADRLREASGLENLPLADWLELLALENLTLLPIVCELVERHVHPERLDLSQCVELACSPVAPVAELGLRWTRTRPVRSAEDLRTLRPLAEARTPRVRGEAAEWLLTVLAGSEHTTRDDARDLIDARHREVRGAGLALFERRFADEPTLWAALSETPYDDVRTRLVARLGQWERRLEASALTRVWATTLLAIHRGGRAKRTVVRQVAERIVAAPEEADGLLPLLGIALRSVRTPERRLGLALVTQAAFRRPALRSAIERLLPELRLDAEVSA